MSSQPLAHPLAPSRPASRGIAPEQAPALAQARAEAWAVLHHAERLGHRDISEALHEALTYADEAAPNDAEAACMLDIASQCALACLDGHGVFAGDDGSHDGGALL